MVETIVNSGFFWGLLGIAMITAMVSWSNKDKKQHTPAHS
jgi:hypothetical protein